MSSPFVENPNRKYGWEVGDRVQRNLEIWDATKEAYVSRLFTGTVTAVYCGIGEYGPYHELYEVTFDEVTFPEIYQGDRRVRKGFFDYGLNKEVLSRQDRLAIAHWKLWRFYFSDRAYSFSLNRELLITMQRVYVLAGGQSTFDNLRKRGYTYETT